MLHHVVSLSKQHTVGLSAMTMDVDIAAWFVLHSSFVVHKSYMRQILKGVVCKMYTLSCSHRGAVYHKVGLGHSAPTHTLSLASCNSLPTARPAM